MKFAAPLILAALMAVATPTAAGPDEREAEAQSVARAWLALVDSGSYAKSWSEASSLFRRSITQPQWSSAVASVRNPLGALKSRTLRSVTFTRSVPGGPDGEYVVVQFASSFDQKESASETVTPMKDTDGRWRVAGYFVR